MNKVGIFLKNNKTSILTVASVAGVFGTAVLTARGQMKADEILSDYYAVEILPDAVEEEDPEEKEWVPIPFKERMKLTWKCYIPSGIAGLLTIASIVGSQYISNKQIAALSASVAMLVANRDQLEDAVRRKYGEDALNELKQSLKLRTPSKEYIQIYAEETGKGKLLCYEGYSGRWFRSEEDEVVRVINEFSERYKNGENLSLNDLYNMLGISESHFGWIYGWVDPECCGCCHCESREDGIPMFVTRVYEPEYKEDVLYIDMGVKDKPYIYPNYPVEGWYEY